MAPNYTQIQITNNDKTINFNDGINYFLSSDGWSPRVATPRANKIGNQCPYEDVTEEIVFSIRGDSADEVALRVSRIMVMLEQAERYVNGDSVDPVYFQVSHQGSNSLWSALVYRAEIILPTDWADTVVGKTCEDARLRITRRGIWTLGTVGDTSTATSNARLSNSLSVESFYDSSYVSELVVTNLNQELSVSHPGLLIVTCDTNNVQYAFGSLLINDVGNLPSGSPPHVHSNPNGAVIDLNTVTAPKINPASKRVAVWGTFKISNPSVPVKCSFIDDTNGPSSPESIFTIPALASNDEPIFIGLFEWNPDSRYMVITPASTVSFFIVDVIVLVNVSDPFTSVIHIPKYTGFCKKFRVSNQVGALSPKVQASHGGTTYMDIPFYGDAWMPIRTLSQAKIMRFAKGEDDKWQPTPLSTNTFALTVQEGSVVPV